MLPNHYRTQDEINGTDTATYRVEWSDGRLMLFHETGNVLARVEHDDPITAKSDSWLIAHLVADRAGLPAPIWCEHDRDSVFFGYDRQHPTPPNTKG